MEPMETKTFMLKTLSPEMVEKNSIPVHVFHRAVFEAQVITHDNINNWFRKALSYDGENLIPRQPLITMIVDPEYDKNDVIEDDHTKKVSKEIADKMLEAYKSPDRYKEKEINNILERARESLKKGENITVSLKKDNIYIVPIEDDVFECSYLGNDKSPIKMYGIKAALRWIKSAITEDNRIEADANKKKDFEIAEESFLLHHPDVTQDMVNKGFIPIDLVHEIVTNVASNTHLDTLEACKKMWKIKSDIGPASPFLRLTKPTKGVNPYKHNYDGE